MVKIDGIAPYSPGSVRKKNKTSGGGFQSKVSSSSTTSAEAQKPSGVTETKASDTLVLIQEVSTAFQAKSEIQLHGENLLNQLEQLQQEMAVGSFSKGALEKLAENLKNRPRESNDHRLEEIVDEIEQRVHIELAKIEMSELANLGL